MRWQENNLLHCKMPNIWIKRNLNNKRDKSSKTRSFKIENCSKTNSQPNHRSFALKSKFCFFWPGEMRTHTLTNKKKITLPKQIPKTRAATVNKLKQTSFLYKGGTWLLHSTAPHEISLHSTNCWSSNGYQHFSDKVRKALLVFYWLLPKIKISHFWGCHDFSICCAQFAQKNKVNLIQIKKLKWKKCQFFLQSFVKEKFEVEQIVVKC